MAWRVARSLDQLLAQLNALAPHRSKVSDGSIGDAAHSSRASDHNPDAQGIVRARDFTHDPAGGLDCNWLAARLAEARDPRLKYVIWNRRIMSGSAGPSPWVWRTFPGDPHTKHLHVSVAAGAVADTTAPWNLGGPTPGGFLMALSDQQQRDLYDRIFGMLRQRYYTIVDSGIAVEVDANHPGAKPATVLDSLDGDYLVQRLKAIEAKESEPAPVELSEAQLEALADKVAARLGALRFDVEEA